MRIRALLRAIPDSELQLLDMSAVDGRPENLLIDRLLVPPVAIRPSVDAGPQGSNEDDLTVKLSEILTVSVLVLLLLQLLTYLTTYYYYYSIPHWPPPPASPFSPSPPLTVPPGPTQVNSIIRNALLGGKASVACVAENWEFLQLQTVHSLWPHSLWLDLLLPPHFLWTALTTAVHPTHGHAYYG